MEKIDLQIEKYSYQYDNRDNYFVYAIPSQKDKSYTEFYIQKEDYGFISFCISLNINQMNCSNQEYINENIIEWIDNYEDDIEVLEDERAIDN